MREFELSDVRIETSGGVLDAFLAALGPYRARGEKVICRHLGVERVSTDAEAFYSLPKFLASMAELQTQFGPNFMHRIGSFIFEKAIFPPGIDNAEKGMSMIDQAYNMNHRNAEGKIGGYRWAPSGPRGGTMLCDNPYPCAFDLGIIETIARRFEAGANVTHSPAACRHRGDDQCSYEVSW